MSTPAVSANDLNVLAITNLFPNACEPQKGVFNKQQFIALTAHAHVRVIAPVPWVPRLPVLRRWKRWHLFAEVPRHEVIDGIEVSHPRYVIFPKIRRRWDATAFAAGIRP